MTSWQRAWNTKPTRDDGLYLETLVYQELRRRGLEVWTYLTPGAEVDFLIREGREVRDLLQVCWSMRDPGTERREVNALRSAARATRCDRLTIITRDEKRTISVDGLSIDVIPAGEWLLNA